MQARIEAKWKSAPNAVELTTIGQVCQLYSALV